MTDVWTSAGVIAGVALVYATGWQRLDPLVALAVAIHVVWTGIGLVRRSVVGLLDAAISPEDQNEVNKIFNEYANRYAEVPRLPHPPGRLAALHLLPSASSRRVEREARPPALRGDRGTHPLAGAELGRA